MPERIHAVPLDSLVSEKISYGIVQPGNPEPGGVPIVRVKDVRNGKIDTSDPLIVARDVEQKYARTRLQGGELLLTLVGSVGEVAVASEEICGWNVARAIAVVRPSSEVTAQWLSLILSSGPAQQYFHDRLNTTVQATLNLKDVRTLPVPMPPQRERDAVCAVVGALDEKIAVNRKISVVSTELAENHYRQAIALSDSWEMRELGVVASVVMGQSPSSEDSNRAGEGFALLNGPTEFGMYSPVPAQWTSAHPRMCDEYDLLLCVRGSTTGRMNWADRAYVIGRGLAAIRSKVSAEETRLIHLSIYCNMAELLARANGSVFPNLSRDAILGFPIPWPADSVRARLVDVIAGLDAGVAARAAESRALAALRDTLLPQLMSGRIRVKDAEKIVEDHV